MPSEAKYGLVVGVALVILIAVVFFRRDAAQARTAEPASAAVKQPGAMAGPRRAIAAEQRRGVKGETPYRPGAGVLPRQRPEVGKE